jgi:hypothetical protein
MQSLIEAASVLKVKLWSNPNSDPNVKACILPILKATIMGIIITLPKF